jgi:hypothetical protein
MSDINNMLDWAVQWGQDYREKHAGIHVLVGLKFEEAIELICTPVGTKSITQADQINLQSQHFRLLFRNEDFLNNNIPIVRGLKIWFQDNVFEIAYQGRLLFEYNDLITMRDLIIQVVFKEKVVHNG